MTAAISVYFTMSFDLKATITLSYGGSYISTSNMWGLTDPHACMLINASKSTQGWVLRWWDADKHESTVIMLNTSRLLKTWCFSLCVWCGGPVVVLLHDVFLWYKVMLQPTVYQSCLKLLEINPTAIPVIGDNK